VEVDIEGDGPIEHSRNKHLEGGGGRGEGGADRVELLSVSSMGYA